MTLDDLPTPCLVLDLGILKRNLARMAAAVARHPGLTLRPHMKTAKSLAVAELAAPGKGPITVSTVAEARYFAGGGFSDQILAVGITPAKLDRIAALNAQGADVKVITDDAEVASAIAAHPGPLRALVEVDCGEGRGGVAPDSALLVEIAARLGARCAGIMTHAGHSYAERSIAGVEQVAEAEHKGALRAAERLRAAGIKVEVVSLGSSPTALHGKDMSGITDVRAGVYMFGDLFQAQIGTHGMEDIAVTVLAAVTGRKPERNAVLVDAGAIALSKDRSTEKAPKDYGFGLMLDIDGRPSFGDAIVLRTHQEHGEVRGEAPLPFDRLPIGALVRIAPNHTCLTVAQHDRYHVVDGAREVIAVWDRVNGW
ncbi:DSD1 family PLP-dependent enzyme [Roseomonas eburnea]|uniref:DSD1 family PLP-dependent enzyme n=1 Tax=Neoroseomonas eburnea TaxID=1346889 RepID=A0A9X9XAN5_9PROT|nr:alanine racemase [Neoroseomonas eburnea]MBR0680771.1 DSD1 family PLP-dependent enzyme [Neoroseomonas eburnea]